MKSPFSASPNYYSVYWKNGIMTILSVPSGYDAEATSIYIKPRSAD